LYLQGGGKDTGEGVFNSKNLGLYTYCHQNPLIMIDPDGAFSIPVPFVNGVIESNMRAEMKKMGVSMSEKASQALRNAGPDILVDIYKDKDKYTFEQKTGAVEETFKNIQNDSSVSDDLKKEIESISKAISSEDIVNTFLMSEGSTRKASIPANESATGKSSVAASEPTVPNVKFEPTAPDSKSQYAPEYDYD
jgi:hypothetical protein